MKSNWNSKLEQLKWHQKLQYITGFAVYVIYDSEFYITMRIFKRRHYLDNNNCAPSFWGHCVKSEVIVLDWGIFLRERNSRRKIPRSKTITDKFTQWPKQRWCKVIIVINNRYFECVFCVFYVYFLNKSTKKTAVSLISVLIPVNEFQSAQTWRSLRDVISARIRGALRAIVCAFTLTREWRPR